MVPMSADCPKTIVGVDSPSEEPPCSLSPTGGSWQGPVRNRGYVCGEWERLDEP